jgi:hypothetical protein
MVSAEKESMLTQAVRDRYRCPKEFLDFRLAGQLSPDAGYFQFGTAATCYGRSSYDRSNGAVQPKVTATLCDAFAGAVIDEKQVLLAFDPDEVIDNLRLERYLPHRWGAFETALKKIYYGIRPLTNLSIRKFLKRVHAANWQDSSFPHWPVDTTVEIICENLLLLSLEAKGVDRIPFVWFWPKGARACVAMTHDVETEAGRDFCPELLDVDDSFGIKAAFQLVPEDRYPITGEFLSQLRDRGFEIGIQDLNHDGRLFDDREEFLRRVALINRYGHQYGAQGFRAAVLYRRPEWFHDLEFSYDMSMPNVAPLDPQRGGCCTVMPYFIGKILELPVTTVQDYTLFHLLNERSIDLWKVQLEMIFAKNGLANFIVHPDYITEMETKSVYKALLGWLSELRKQQALWFALPREIDNWWRARNQMSIVKDGRSWKVVGEGAENAVLAYAKIADGQLIYELETSRELCARR